MTTHTTNSTTTKGPNPPDNEKLDKVRNWIKDHLFTIALAVAVLVTTLALMGSGFVGAFQYDDAMGTIIGWFNLAIMIYPIILLIQKRQHFALRLGIIITSFVFAIFVLPFEVRLLGEFGAALWKVPILGSVILPIAAVVLHALTAFLLTRYDSKESDAETEKDKAKLPGLEKNIVDVETEISSAKNEVVSRKTDEKAKQDIYDALDDESKARAKDFKDAETAFNENPLVMERVKVKALLATNQGLRTDLTAALEEKQARIDKISAPGVKAQHQEEFDTADSELTDLQLKGKALKIRLEELEVEIAASPEQSAKDEALRLSTDASKEASKSQAVLETASKATKAAEAEFSSKSHKLELEEEELATTEARITAAEAAQRGKYRDVAFLPIVTLILAMVLYSTWYGWVLTTIG